MGRFLRAGFILLAMGMVAPTVTVAKPKASTRSSTKSHASSGKKSGGSKGGKGSKCVASGGYTNNAGNCCSHRYNGPVKATDLHNQCK